MAESTKLKSAYMKRQIQSRKSLQKRSEDFYQEVNRLKEQTAELNVFTDDIAPSNIKQLGLRSGRLRVVLHQAKTKQSKTKTKQLEEMPKLNMITSTPHPTYHTPNRAFLSIANLSAILKHPQLESKAPDSPCLVGNNENNKECKLKRMPKVNANSRIPKMKKGALKDGKLITNTSSRQAQSQSSIEASDSGAEKLKEKSLPIKKIDVNTNVQSIIAKQLNTPGSSKNTINNSKLTSKNSVSKNKQLSAAENCILLEDGKKVNDENNVNNSDLEVDNLNNVPNVQNASVKTRTIGLSPIDFSAVNGAHSNGSSQAFPEKIINVNNIVDPIAQCRTIGLSPIDFSAVNSAHSNESSQDFSEKRMNLNNIVNRIAESSSKNVQTSFNFMREHESRSRITRTSRLFLQRNVNRETKTSPKMDNVTNRNEQKSFTEASSSHGNCRSLLKTINENNKSLTVNRKPLNCYDSLEPGNQLDDFTLSDPFHLDVDDVRKSRPWRFEEPNSCGRPINNGHRSSIKLNFLDPNKDELQNHPVSNDLNLIEDANNQRTEDDKYSKFANRNKAKQTKKKNRRRKNAIENDTDNSSLSDGDVASSEASTEIALQKNGTSCFYLRNRIGKKVSYTAKRSYRKKNAAKRVNNVIVENSKNTNINTYNLSNGINRDVPRASNERLEKNSISDNEAVAVESEQKSNKSKEQQIQNKSDSNKDLNHQSHESTNASHSRSLKDRNQMSPFNMLQNSQNQQNIHASNDELSNVNDKQASKKLQQSFKFVEPTRPVTRSKKKLIDADPNKTHASLSTDSLGVEPLVGSSSSTTSSSRKRKKIGKINSKIKIIEDIRFENGNIISTSTTNNSQKRQVVEGRLIADINPENIIESNGTSRPQRTRRPVRYLTNIVFVNENLIEKNRSKYKRTTTTKKKVTETDKSFNSQQTNSIDKYSVTCKKSAAKELTSKKSKNAKMGSTKKSSKKQNLAETVVNRITNVHESLGDNRISSLTVDLNRVEIPLGNEQFGMEDPINHNSSNNNDNNLDKDNVTSTTAKLTPKESANKKNRSLGKNPKTKQSRRKKNLAKTKINQIANVHEPLAACGTSSPTVLERIEPPLSNEQVEPSINSNHSQTKNEKETIMTSDYISYVDKDVTLQFKYVHRPPQDSDFNQLKGNDKSIHCLDYAGYCLSRGFIRLKPGQVKEVKNSTYEMFYTVTGGVAQIQCSNSTSEVKLADSFTIPLGSNYSIRNISKIESLILLYTRNRIDR